MRPVGSQGEEAWSAPLGCLGGLAGWRFGDARDLTRSRGFAAAGFGARLHLPASVVEVHVAARRLRRIVPLGIRPNGTIPLRGERPSSDSTRPFELSSGIFIMRKAVAAIRRRNTLSAVPLAIQKPAGQANNPTCRRLRCFFVLTKGMSVVGPRPVVEDELAAYGDDLRTFLSAKPGITGWWQVQARNDATYEDGSRQELELWRGQRIDRESKHVAICIRCIF